jgi:presequence protease
VFSQKSLRVAITCGHEIQSENRTAVSNLLETLPSFPVPSKPSGLSIGSLPSRAFFTLPYSVNYAALSYKGVPYTHPDSAVLKVLANLIDQKRIHAEIREKGGAYGGGANYSSLQGIFAITSYRDPTFERSLEIMRDAGRWMTEQNVDNDTLSEMKLSIFKDVDAPISVREEGMQEFLDGITGEMKQTYIHLRHN